MKGTVTSWLVCGQVQVMPKNTTQRPRPRHFIITVPLSTQEHKWVPANSYGNLRQILGCNLRWQVFFYVMVANPVHNPQPGRSGRCFVCPQMLAMLVTETSTQTSEGQKALGRPAIILLTGNALALCSTGS